MVTWPANLPDDVSAIPEGARQHHLEVLLDAAGRVADVRLDGESIWPTWFKLEWKGDGQVSAKAGGLRLSTRGGDRITVRVPAPEHVGAPEDVGVRTPAAPFQLPSEATPRSEP